MTENIKLQYALLCDDLRREDNGKLIIIGLYDSDIFLKSYPAKLVLTVLTRLKIAEAEELSVEVEGVLNDQRVTHGKANIAFHTGGFAFVPFQRFPITIKEKGHLVFRMKLADRGWISLWEGTVDLMPAETTFHPASNELEQLS